MQFEYVMVEMPMYELKREPATQLLNRMGAEGWELVSTCGLYGSTFVFKRAVAPRAQKKERG